MDLSFKGAEKITLIDLTQGLTEHTYECEDEDNVMHCDGAKVVVTLAAYEEQ